MFVRPPLTITADLAYELCDVLAGLCGFAEGTGNAFPTLKATTDPLVARAEAAADKIRPLLAASIADEMSRSKGAVQ